MVSILHMNYASKRKILYEGSSKIILEGEDSDSLIQYFKDDDSSDCGKFLKSSPFSGKGVTSNLISEYIMLKLESIGITTHLIKRLSMREQLIRKLDMIPLKVVVRNVAAGDLALRFGLEEGVVLPSSIIEFYLKSSNLNYPLVSEDHISAFNWANSFELEEIRDISVRINDFLTGLFLGCGIRIIDFKLEFGRSLINDFEQVMVADEISPNCCRLWDLKTNEKFDYEANKETLDLSYAEVAKRLGLSYNYDKNTNLN